MTVRAMGAFNGLLPEPTGQVVAFMRDPAQMPYLRYTQFVPAPEIQFMWCRFDQNEPARLVTLDKFAWAYDDYRPAGKDWHLRADWVADRTQRWDFPWIIGEQTLRVWGKAGINVKALLDNTRMNHAHLHRAVRILDAMRAAAYGAYNSGTPQDLLGEAAPVYFDDASGQEYLANSGNPNPNFQLVKRTLQALVRRVHLATNGAVNKRQLIWVLSPSDAQLLSRTGEIVDALKQSRNAGKFTVQDEENANQWNLPGNYGGVALVVEDTPRVIVRQKEGDTGTIADVAIPAEKDYILKEGESFVVSRPGELDGTYGTQNFSTVQVYTFNGEARVEAFSDAKHELIEGHIVMEDKVVVPTTVSGFKLTGFRK